MAELAYSKKIMDLKILAIIPARAGSKRLPKKNIRLLNGKSLIEYSIDIAQSCKYIDDIIITSNDNEVEKIAKRRNIKYRKRPECLCTDSSDTQGCVDDILKFYGNKWDILILLQPTSPLRKIEDINRCIELYVEGKFTTVISVTEIVHNVYHANGSIYVFKDIIFSKNAGFILFPKDESIDINTELDFKLVEMVVNNNV